MVEDAGGVKMYKVMDNSGEENEMEGVEGLEDQNAEGSSTDSDGGSSILIYGLVVLSLIALIL
jgi:hypothetical protein